jgi:PAS domain S-box-containing protein
MVVVWLGSEMGDGCDDRFLSASEVAALRRRIAELERANEQLLAGDRRRYEDLIENMNDIIYTTDRAGTVLSINQAVQRTFGFDPQEVIGTHYGRWMPKEESDKLEAARFDTLKGQRTTNQIVISDKEGNEHHVEISVSPLIVDGRIEGTQGIIRDITARHRAERAAREGEEMLRAIFNATTESILLVEGDGKILATNDTAARRFGCSPHELIGRRWLDVNSTLMSPAAAHQREAMILKVLETGEAISLEDERAGLYLDAVAYPVFDENGRATRVAVFAKDVTEQKKALEEARKFKAVFDNAAYGATIADCSGNLLYINEAWARMHGDEPAELSGQHLSILHSEGQLPVVNRLLDQLTAEGSFAEEEVWHVRKDGTEFPTLMNATIIRDDRGQALFWAGMAMDITERQRAEEEIQKLQRRTEFILGATKTGLNITDKDFNLRYVDPAWQRTYGGYEGKKCYEYFLGTDHPCSGCGVAKAVETKQMVTYDGVLPKEGNRPIQVTTIPFQAENGEWLVAEVNVDITERKLLEQKLRESEQRYRTVVETAGETIAIVDAQGVFRFMNTTAGRRLGGQPGDFIGKTMWDLFPKDVADRQAAYVREVIESERGKSTFSLSNVRGELRWYYTTVEPLRDDAGKVTAGLVIARDVHELRTAQQELDTYREKMIRAEHLASLGTLSAMLAHEMTQPLMVIRLSIQNARKTLEVASIPATVLDDLKGGLAEISNVTAIVERFRTFASRASDQTIDKVSLSVVAQRVMRLLEESARKARVALEVDQLDKLPPIHTYGKDIEQIFFALAQNAIQAAEGRRDHFFRILGARRDDHVELQFTDDCGGIAPKVLEHLFEPFWTTKPSGEGTGLGLCVVERIVSQVGGHLKVDSRWGKGTTFFIMLPVKTI